MGNARDRIANEARASQERRVLATERLAAAALLLNDSIVNSEIHCVPNHGKGQTSIKAAFSRIVAFTSAIAAYRKEAD
jgi:hypothetical protein